MSADPGTLTAKAYGSDGYTGVEHLLFMILDELRAANWQRGGKGRRPKRVSPLARNKGAKRYGKTDRPPSEVAALLAQVGPAKKS